MSNDFILLTEDGGVKKRLLLEGNGESPSDGLEVQVYYTGKLEENGKVFDSTNSGNPFRFILGEGQVIKGWDIGVKSMRKGEKAEFILAPNYAYGEKGISDIPPNATLNFEIELVEFAPKAKSKYEMDYPEIMANAKQLKEDGIKFFQEKKFDEAILKFDEGFSFMDAIDKNSKTPESQELTQSFLLNMSNCFNNLKQWDKTVKKIKSALEIKDHPRAFYFRGVALANLEEFELANTDLEKLKTLVPENEPG
jgi:peptidylprolyl isomerase